MKKVVDQVADIDAYESLCDEFDQGLRLTIGDTASAEELVESMQHVEGLTDSAKQFAQALGMSPDNVGMLASAGELLLEWLYVHNRLSKHIGAAAAAYSR